ncbi:hypothetical protein [Companilactobacillus musae]|uniref:hypothetical protein n=1 Tax=Companilactobacillus musae TaxID=1903258 RepID=UPI0013C34883|nr:hypothetical protein [Companilactobacillus musae]
MNNKTLIGSRTSKLTGQSKIDDLTADWTEDSGILLQNNKPDLSGDYNGVIHWDLEDVPD